LDNVMQRGAAKRVVAVAAVATIALVALAVLRPIGAGASVQAPTQTTRKGTTKSSAAPSTTPTTDVTITTPVAPGQTAPNGGPLLVPGASDAPASKADEVKNNDNTGTVVALVISGLLVVALLLGLLTYWFWRNTRPAKVPQEPDPPKTAKEPSAAPAGATSVKVGPNHAGATKAGDNGAAKSPSDEPAGAN
jgi:hypothetical protein